MQHVFADADSPWAMNAFADAVPGVNALVGQYVGRTVFTRFVPPAEPTGGWRGYYALWPFALTPESARLWEIVPEVPTGGAPVVDAPTMSKWVPGLWEVVGNSRDLVICGVSTDCCVLSTTLAAFDGGAQVRVVSDACVGLSPGSHDRALQAMSLYGPQVQVVMSAELAVSRSGPGVSGR